MVILVKRAQGVILEIKVQLVFREIKDYRVILVYKVTLVLLD